MSALAGEARPWWSGQTIDAHHHRWDLSVRPQSWLADPPYDTINRSFSLTDHHHTAQAGVAGHPLLGGVLVQCLPLTAETEEFLADAGEDPATLAVVGWADLTDPGIVDELARLQSLPGGHTLRAIRHLVQGESDPGWLTRPAVLNGLRAVAAAGLTYDVLIFPHQLGAALTVAEQVPELPLVIDHAAKPNLRTGRFADQGTLAGWTSPLRRLADHQQVSVKLSGLVTEADLEQWTIEVLRPVTSTVLDAYGPERVMWGSDWPVCLVASTWHRWAETSAELLSDLAPVELDHVLAGTAVRHYGLIDPLHLPA